MEFTLVPTDLLTKHENHQGNVIRLEEKEGEAARRNWRRLLSDRRYRSMVPLHMVPLAQAKSKTLPLLRDIEAISNCCLLQRFVFLGVVCRLFGSLSSAVLYV